MEIVLAWLTSSLVSAGIEIGSAMSVFKDIADKGYKVDLTKESKVKSNKKSFLKMLIPGYNLIHAVKEANRYSKQSERDKEIEAVKKVYDIVEMTESEKKEYQENPTATNALLIMLKPAIEKNRKHIIEINDTENNGSMLCQVGNSLDDVKVLIAYGSFAKLSKEERLEKAKDALSKVGKAITERYDDIIETIEKSAETGEKNIRINIDLNQSKAQNSTSDSEEPNEEAQSFEYVFQDAKLDLELHDSEKTVTDGRARVRRIEDERGNK